MSTLHKLTDGDLWVALTIAGMQHWYRGGLDAWHDAGFLVPRTPSYGGSVIK